MLGSGYGARLGAICLVTCAANSKFCRRLRTLGWLCECLNDYYEVLDECWSVWLRNVKRVSQIRHILSQASPTGCCNEQYRKKMANLDACRTSVDKQAMLNHKHGAQNT